MKKYILGLAVISTLAFTACSSSNNEEQLASSQTDTDVNVNDADATFAPVPIPQLSVGMVSEGPISDESFSQGIWDGLERFKADTGVSVKFLESAQESDFSPNLELLADQGNSLIFAAGFTMADAVLDAANKNPETNYVLVDFTEFENIPDNLTMVAFKEEEGAFLAGYLAAKTTTTDRISFIGGIKSDVISRFEYGYRAGAMHASNELGRDIEVSIQYVDSFDDTAKGKAIAIAEYSAGSDIIMHAAGGAGKGVIEAAKEQDKFVIGVDVDQVALAPDNVITSVLKNTGAVAYELSNYFNDDMNVNGGIKIYGLSDGAVGLAYNESTERLVDAAVFGDTLAVQDEIINGQLIVPGNEADFNSYVEK
jgi:basic membrane protein A